MNHAAGIFADRRSAQAAWEKLRRADFKDENLIMLTPEQSPDQVETIATVLHPQEPAQSAIEDRD